MTYGYDGHGSVRFLTDVNGNVTDTLDYDAFGILVDRTGNTPVNYRYSGEQWDEDLGMYYLRARYLNVGTGRFWSMDSYEGSKASPISLHKYLYADSNPVTNWDPTGNATNTVEVAFVISTRQVMGIIYIGYLGSRVEKIINNLGRPDIPREVDDDTTVPEEEVPVPAVAPAISPSTSPATGTNNQRGKDPCEWYNASENNQPILNDGRIDHIFDNHKPNNMYGKAYFTIAINRSNLEVLIDEGTKQAHAEYRANTNPNKAFGPWIEETASLGNVSCVLRSTSSTNFPVVGKLMPTHTETGKFKIAARRDPKYLVRTMFPVKP